MSSKNHKNKLRNHSNRDKIKKAKIKKRIKISVLLFLVVAFFVGAIFLLLKDRNIYVKEDNYTNAMNVAVQKFAYEDVLSHDYYPRLSYNYKSLPTTHPSQPDVEDENNNDIQIEYDDDNNRIEIGNTTDKETSVNNQEIESDSEDNNRNKEEESKTEV